MNKKLLVIVALAFLLSGCGSYSDYINYEVMERFKNIEEERFLFYDKKTNIIYYFINGYWENDGCYSMPYISENGKFCKYINGEIVEVQDE